MKIPQKPPNLNHLLLKLLQNNGAKWLLANPVGPIDYKGRYLRWDKLRRLPPPEGLNPKQHWLLTKISRSAITKQF